MKQQIKARLRSLWRLFGVRGPVDVARDVHIGIGSYIWSPNGLVIEKGVYVGKYCTIECSGVIGRETMIANSVGIVGRLDHDMKAIGQSIRKSPRVRDAAHKHRLDRPVYIGCDCWIGYSATIVSGVSIGRGAVVGAGSVVSSDVAAYAIVVGNPARVVGWRFNRDEIELHEQQLGF